MILKEQDDRISDIEVLKRLMCDPRMDERSRRRVREQINRIESGDLGEAQAAYLLKVHFGADPDWIVLNDLRIEVGGLTAQIDHLLVNRLLEFWVCESKRFSQGVKINDHGEFITFRDGIPRASQSPIEQNARHMKILAQLLQSDGIRLPTRLGFRLKPQLKSLILISGGAIRRPRASIPGLETVIMADQVHARIAHAMNNGNPFDLVKLISRETLLDIGQQLLTLNRPVDLDWERRFLPPAAERPAPAQRRSGQITARVRPALPTPVPAKALACADCAASVSKGVASFCRRSADRFGGKLLCIPCQERRTGPEPELAVG